MIKLRWSLLSTIPAREKRITISTGLTLSRILLTPVIIGTMIMGMWGCAFFLFSIAALTDLLDGLLARMLNQQTFLGACLDPIADKFLVVSIFTALAFVTTPLFSLPYWFLFFVLAKEVIQVAGAIIIYRRKGYLVVRPTLLGKLTMCLQIFFIVWLFACYFFGWMPLKTYSVMLGLVILFVGASFVQYGIIGVRQLRV